MNNHLLSPSNSLEKKLNILSYCNWYWGKVDKDVISACFENQPDGTFAVRDASTKNDYTLTIRVNGSNKLIKIFVENEKYRFTQNTLDFNSLPELIQYYRKRSLKDYNKILNVCLLYPLACKTTVKMRLLKLEDVNTLNVEILKCKLEGLYAEHERMSRHCDQMLEQKNILVEECGIKKLTLKAYLSAQNAFLSKIDILKRTLENQSENYRAEFYCNIELQKERVLELTKAQTLMSNAIDNLEKTILRIDEELEVVKPRLALLQKHKNECYDLLKRRHISNINRFFKEINFVLDQEPVKLSNFLLAAPWPPEPQYWLLSNCDKENAINILNAAISNYAENVSTNGIFLIRPSQSHNGFFVLVISMNSIIHNCLIEYRDSMQTDECGYGFQYTDMFFSTLIDFVRYYSQVNLREHNSQLDTTLTKPALL